MKVYLVVHHDRHADDGYYTFARQDPAINFAVDRLDEFNRFGDAKEQPYNANLPERIWHGTYGEDNWISVHEVELRG